MEGDLRPLDTPASVTRRSWLDALLGMSFVAWALAVVYPSSGI